jgi:hypothetical protein
MSDKISGGCLCGAVTYEVVNDFTRFYFCHCGQCQKLLARPMRLIYLLVPTP